MTTNTKTTKSIERAARTLEGAFFLKEDSILIKRLKVMKKMAETKEALAEVSGISNDAILARLVELDVKPEIVAALAAVPLIEVAWADGTISREEREAVLAHANNQGISPGSIEYELLERWLAHRPEPKLLKAWQTYVQGLCEKLSDSERALLKEELLHSTQTTAQAAGGFLGVGRISTAEQKVLDMLEASFCA
jgi:hypothetical protein